MTRLRGSNHSALRYVTRCVLLLLLAAPPVCVRSRPRALLASFALGEEGGGGGVRRQWPRRRQHPPFLALVDTRAPAAEGEPRGTLARAAHRPPAITSRRRDCSVRAKEQTCQHAACEAVTASRRRPSLHLLWLSLVDALMPTSPLPPTSLFTPTSPFPPTRPLLLPRILCNYQFIWHPMFIPYATQKLSVNK